LPTTSLGIMSATPFAPATSTAPMAGWRGSSLEPYMLATPTAGLLPSARLLLLCAIRETGPGAWNEPRKDATRAKFCMWASHGPQHSRRSPF
jgi:hypothetical protein